MAFSIRYDYQIVDRMSAIFARIGKAAQTFDSRITRTQATLGRMQTRMQATGARVSNLQTGLAGLGAGLMLRSAMRESMEFAKSINMLSAVTGATGDDLDMMRQRALLWGSQTQFSSVQVGQAMAEFGKKGLELQQILEVMPGTMSLAAAGEIEMGQAASYTMGILAQFGLELDKSGELSDILATAASNSATSVQGIASAMSNTGLQAKMAGLSVSDATAALMAMAQQNLEGAEAGTMMMNALRQLTVMTPKIRKGFAGLGINIDQFRDSTTGQMKDFFGLISAMQDAGATAADLGGMFDIRAMKAMAVLVETNTDEMNKFRGLMDETAGGAKAMSDTLLAGPVGTMVRLASVTQNLKVVIGELTAQAIGPLVVKLTALLGNLQQNNPGLLKFLTYALLITAALAAFLIPLGLMISTIGSIIGIVKVVIGLTKVWSAVQAVLNLIMSANPIFLIILGVMALIAIVILLVKHWDKVKAFFVRTFQTIRDWLLKAWDWFSALLDNPLWVALGYLFLPFITIPAMIVKHWSKIKQFFIDLWAGITGTVIRVKDMVVGVFNAIVEKLKIVWDWFSAFLDNPFFAALSYIFTPFITLPALIIKHWEPIKAFFTDLWNTISEMTGKIVGTAGKVKEFFTGGADARRGLLSQLPFGRGRDQVAPMAPVPGAREGAARAEASVSVYTEKGMGVEPFAARGNLGYNMAGSYTQ